ncbi:hypothetical protein Dimus_004429 [Dionaea muscipula]
MAATSKATQSRDHAKSNVFHRSSVFPSPGSFSSSTSSNFAASSFSSHCSSSIFHRPSSPTRVSLSAASTAPNKAVPFLIESRPTSPCRSVVAVNQIDKKQGNHRQYHHHLPLENQKNKCLCSPTTHPGSFRCRLHRNGNGGRHQQQQQKQSMPLSYRPNRLNMRRSTMTNSLVRIGTVEGEWLKRALAMLIRPSSHRKRRRDDFQPKPSRLSIMSRAEDP